MSLLEIWGLIKVMGFSLSLLLGLPLGGGFYVWGVWNGEQGGITLDGYGIWEHPIPGACGIATPWGIMAHDKMALGGGDAQSVSREGQ